MMTFVASTDEKYQSFRKRIHVLSYRVAKGEKAINAQGLESLRVTAKAS